MICNVVLNLVPLISSGFTAPFIFVRLFWFQVFPKLLQISLNCWILLYVYIAPCKNNIKSCPFRLPFLYVPSPQPWLDKFFTFGVFGDKSFPCSFINYKGFIKTCLICHDKTAHAHIHREAFLFCAVFPSELKPRVCSRFQPSSLNEEIRHWKADV